MNRLYYGDNLDVLRRHVADESVDLVYLDPPFQSGRDYNVLFEEQDGTKASAQIQAFEDTWEWDQRAAAAFDEVVSRGGRVASALEAFRQLLGPTPMLAYVSMIAPRLIELRRVLRRTGSIYLHCDPTASAHLRLLMDAIFGPQTFRNEIVWRRTSSHNDSRKWAQISDTILFYAGQGFTWNPTYLAHDPQYVENFYRFKDKRGQYRLHEIIRTASMGPRPNLAYEYKGYTPEWGWRMIRPKVEALDREDRITWSSTGRPYLKRYLSEQEGTPISSIITDIPPLSHAAAERLGYPTQKPEALLERIIAASSNEGDVVLDPFCGCGTTIAVAQGMNREWIGIDITHLAVGLMKYRLLHAYGLHAKTDYQVVGEPTTFEGAKQLALDDRHQFEHWALGLVGARQSAKGKGADRGIDGQLSFQEGGPGTEHKRVLISVKSGGVKSGDIRDLVGTIEREKATMGWFITLEKSSRPMRTEAASSGFYGSPWGKHQRIQIMTIEELLDGKRFDCPPIRPGGTTYRQPRRVLRVGDQGALPLQDRETSLVEFPELDMNRGVARAADGAPPTRRAKPGTRGKKR